MTCPKDTNPLACALPLLQGLTGTSLMILRSPGRPKDMEKRSAILAAATELFAQRGMEGVPVEMIAAAAGVSKVTVYANFKDKAAILEAIVARETSRLAQEVTSRSQVDGNLGDRLRRVGGALVAMLNEPCHLALDRCLTLEAQRNPDLGRRFFDAGPGHLRNVLAEMLTQAHAAGEIAADCPRTAAEDLLGLWLGFSAVEKRFLCKSAQPDDMQARIERGVTLFLRAYAAQ